MSRHVNQPPPTVETSKTCAIDCFRDEKNFFGSENIDQIFYSPRHLLSRHCRYLLTERFCCVVVHCHDKHLFHRLCTKPQPRISCIFSRQTDSRRRCVNNLLRVEPMISLRHYAHRQPQINHKFTFFSSRSTLYQTTEYTIIIIIKIYVPCNISLIRCCVFISVDSEYTYRS